MTAFLIICIQFGVSFRIFEWSRNLSKASTEVSDQLGKPKFCVLMDEIFTLSIPLSDPHSILMKRVNSERETVQYHLSCLLFCQTQQTAFLVFPESSCIQI